MCDCFCNLAVSSVGSIAHNARKEVTICSSADSCRCLHWRRKEKAEQSDFWCWTGRPWELGFSCPLSTSEQKLPDPSAFPATSLQWGPMTTNCCINSTHGMSRFPISLSFNPILLSLKFRCSHCLTTIVFFLLTILLLSTHYQAISMFLFPHHLLKYSTHQSSSSTFPSSSPACSGLIYLLPRLSVQLISAHWTFP